MKKERKRLKELKQEYEGQVYPFNNGNSNIKMRIVDCKKYDEVTVQVGDTDMYITTTIDYIKRGLVRNPFKENCPIGFMDSKYEYLGCIFRTNQGYLIRVLNCEDRKKVLYEFLDNRYRDTTTMQNIIKGEVRNPYHRDKFGGYLGADKTYRNDGQYKWLYTIWKTILIKRGKNNTNYYLKYHTGYSYDNVMFDERWYCYGYFAQWYMERYSQLNPNFKYVVDKDLKFPFYAQYTNGRKCYGPGTCVLIPVEINHLISTKEITDHHNIGETGFLPKDHPLKTTTEFYKEQNAIPDDVYNIIMNM